MSRSDSQVEVDITINAIARSVEALAHDGRLVDATKAKEQLTWWRGLAKDLEDG